MHIKTAKQIVTAIQIPMSLSAASEMHSKIAQSAAKLMTILHIFPFRF